MRSESISFNESENREGIHDFAAGKAEALAYLTREKEGRLLKREESLDGELRELVDLLNHLSFLYTTYSYIGYLVTKDNAERGFASMGENEAITNRGYITFIADENAISLDFIAKLKELESAFADVEIATLSLDTPKSILGKEHRIIHFGRSSGRPIPLTEARQIEAEKERFLQRLKTLVAVFLEK